MSLNVSLDYTIGSSMASTGLKHRLERFLDTLKSQGFLATLHEVRAGEASYYSLQIESAYYRTLENGATDVDETLRHGIANMVAETIVEDLEPLFLRRILQAWKARLIGGEVDEIVASARERFSIYESVKGTRKQSVVQRLLDYVNEGQWLNIEGFVRFRLRDYVVQLENNLTKAVEQLELERRKKELIQALRQFMELQEPSVEQLHILPDQHFSFHLVDEHGRGVHDDYLDSFVWDLVESDAVDREELLLSALVMLAPTHIVCHLRQASWRLALLDGVFYDRMTYCGGCSRCLSQVR